MSAPLLQVNGLVAGYNGVAVLHGLDLTVEAGEVVAILGANGAGKSTALLSIADALKPMSGEVLLEGSPVRGGLEGMARSGAALVTDDRAIFKDLSVRDNLRLGRGSVAAALDEFTELKPLLHRRAGLLSGGEQQMMTIGRALAAQPKLFMADEMSQGLAPIIVSRLLRAARRAADAGAAVLLVEQHVRLILNVADRAYVLQRGNVTMSGTAAELRSRLGTVEEAYLSTAH